MLAPCLLVFCILKRSLMVFASPILLWQRALMSTTSVVSLLFLMLWLGWLPFVLPMLSSPLKSDRFCWHSIFSLPKWDISFPKRLWIKRVGVMCVRHQTYNRAENWKQQQAWHPTWASTPWEMCLPHEGSGANAWDLSMSEWAGHLQSLGWRWHRGHVGYSGYIVHVPLHACHLSYQILQHVQSDGFKVFTWIFQNLCHQCIWMSWFFVVILCACVCVCVCVCVCKLLNSMLTTTHGMGKNHVK